MSLAGKVVVITGASSGIGAQLARVVFARGGKCVIASRKLDLLEKIQEECGGENSCLAVRCDVSIRSDHVKLLSRALEKFNNIDVWV